jgi:hypothetical protein
MAKQAGYVFWQEMDNNGEPLAGGTIETFEAGTSTNKQTFTSEDESAANTNPIVLDASGRADIWLDSGSYKFVMKDSTGATIRTVDDITAGTSDVYSSGVVDVSTNTSIVASFSNLVVDCTGTITLSLLDVATAEEGFIFVVKNSGSGVVTIDPDGAELIDGASTKDIHPDGSMNITCTGTAWITTNENYGTDFRGKFFVSSNDETAGDLETKLLVGDGLSLGTQNDGSNETRTINLDNPVTFNYLTGLVLSNDTDTDHDINITAGQAADSTNASYLTLSAETTKQIDSTWAAGDDAGGLFTGTVAADTTYHMFIIEKDSDGSIDAGFDTSLTAANIPSGYTKFRRIGSVVTDSSSNIINFVQRGGEFLFKSPILDYSAAVTSTASTVSLSVPSDINVKASLNANVAANSNSVYISSPDQDDELPSITVAPLASVGSSGTNHFGQLEVWTNTSAEVRARAVGNNTLRVATLGYTDLRGQ